MTALKTPSVQCVEVSGRQKREWPRMPVTRASLHRKFVSAPAIFANNDVKYDTNKMRAQKFAAERCATITYAPAKDTPSQDALRERPTLHLEEMKWLQRHDRESGDLYTTQISLPPRLPQRDH